MHDDVEIITDPLAWQKEIDRSGLSVNMRGSARFWKTVEAHGIPVVYRNGAPEFSEIVFSLGDNIGLELSVTDDWPFIRYAFVEIEKE